MSAAVDFVSDVGEFVGDAFKVVGDITMDAVQAVGAGIESVGQAVGGVIEGALNDPIGTIAKVAAIATQQYWMLPLISAATVVANGGDLGQAALAAGISYAGMYIASGVSDYLVSGAESSLTGVENLSDGSSLFSYSDGSTMLQTADGLTNFTAPTTITGSLNTAISNAAGNAATTALRGGDLSEILTSGLTGGAGTYVNLESTQGLKDLGLAAPIANVLGTTSGAVTRGALSGQDAGEVFNTALINNIISTSLSQAGNEIKKTDVFKGLQKSVNETVNEFKDSFNSSKQKFLDELNKNDDLTAKSQEQIAGLIEQSNTLKSEADSYRDGTLTPAQEIAQKAYEKASTSYDEYKTKSAEFSNLVSQYDEAKAAGNTELANSLADQANALIPALNSVTDKYNADYSVYDSAKTDFETKNQTYVGYIDKSKELDSQYSNINKQLQDQNEITKQASNEFNTVYNQIQENANNVAKQVDSAYETASKYGSIAKDTFKDVYLGTGDLNKAINLSQQVNSLPEDNQRMYEFATSFGLRPEDALEFAPDVSKMSVVAQQTFYDSLAENPDTANAFNTAQQINSLDKAQQDSFFNAKIQGLDTAQALDISSNISGLSKEQQNTYIDTVKSGLGSPLASIFAAAQGLTGQGTQLGSSIDQDLASLKTPEAKAAYQYYLNAQFDPKEALSMAQGAEQSILAQGTGSQYASLSGDIKYGESGGVGDVQLPKVNVRPAADLLVQGTGTTGGITPEELEAYRKEGIPEEDIQKLVSQYGTAPSATSTDQPDYYQSLIDRIFTSPTTKAKTLAKAAPSTGGQEPTPGGQTPTQPSVLPEGYSYTAPPAGIYTTVQPKDGYRYAYGPSGDRIEVPGTGGGGGTQPGTGVGGGTEPGAGGGGGTQPGTGAGGGTGGTGTGGTGNIGFGIGGIGGGGFAIPGGFGLLSQDATGGIKNLTPGLTERMDYNLAGLSSDKDNVNPMYNAPQIISQMAAGGSTYDPFSTKDTSGGSGIGSGISAALTPGLTKAQINYILTGMPDYLQGRAEGGHIENHNPEFYSEGGLSSMENRYVKGNGDGTSDEVPAMLANGEFVIPADVVSSLGNGSNDSGASVLDEFLKVIRDHKRKADSKNLPPDSKGPLAYLVDAQRKAKA